MKNFRPNDSLLKPQLVFRRPSSGGNDTSGEVQQLAGDLSPTPDQISALAMKLTAARARRSKFMSNTFFAEPAWDMLLALFNAEAGGYRMTVSTLCEASQVPATTALRWITALHEHDLVLRQASPQDGRIFYIELKPAARAAIIAYLKEVWGFFFAGD